MASRYRIAAAIFASMAVSVPFIGIKEGRSLDPYKDLADRWTVCNGETRVEMRRYSAEECDEMLREAVFEFSEGVLKCTPGLVEHPRVLAAAASLAYNIGLPAYCQSTIAKRFNAGAMTEGCNGFPAWHYSRVDGKLTPVRGLLLRRNEEREICLSGLG